MFGLLRSEGVVATLSRSFLDVIQRRDADVYDLRMKLSAAEQNAAVARIEHELQKREYQQRIEVQRKEIERLTARMATVDQLLEKCEQLATRAQKALQDAWDDADVYFGLAESYAAEADDLRARSGNALDALQGPRSFPPSKP